MLGKIGGLMDMAAPWLGAVRRWWKLALLGALVLLCAWLVMDNRAKDATIREKDARIGAIEQAGLTAKAEQEAVNLGKELFYAHAAIESERRHAAQLADVRDATDRFIAAQRLRIAQGGGGAIAGGAAAPADGAGLPAALPTGAELVAVESRDVRICGDLYAYARDAHDWALTVTVPSESTAR